METITFSAFNPIGTLINPVISVTGVTEYGTDNYDLALNQSKVITADGNSVVSGNSIKRTIGVLIMKGISKAEGLALKAWFRDTLDMQNNYLGINLNSYQIDLGLGAGVNITYTHRARYRYDDSSRLAKFDSPGEYALRLDYDFRRVS